MSGERYNRKGLRQDNTEDRAYGILSFILGIASMAMVLLQETSVIIRDLRWTAVICAFIGASQGIVAFKAGGRRIAAVGAVLCTAAFILFWLV